MDFDWPYRDDNGPATVADWWEHTDCRVMRIAVGEDNQYLNAAVADTSGADDPDNSVPAETSKGGFCGHFPGSDMIPVDGEPISVAAQARDRRRSVRALLGLPTYDAGRPSNLQQRKPTGIPSTIWRRCSSRLAFDGESSDR